MCGIAGTVNRSPGNTTEHMLRALAHRGPDENGTLADAGAQFHHARLSIIDLGGGRQPITADDGRYWLVCNGEIYNYRELRSRLEADGYRFSTESDSEVLLHLYRKYDERMLEHVRGMFAFAIWDKTERTLFAARDHLGQKPFYYHAAEGGLAFASEIKALLELDPSLRTLDPRALDQYFALRLVAPPLSMFKGVRKLPPAHWLRFTPGGEPEIRRYWQPDYEPKWDRSEDDLLDELEAVLVDSVRAHMVADVPVGAFLSGGLDSSLIVALLAREGLAKGLPTFTLGLSHAGYDEAPHARRVSEYFGTEHHEQQVDPGLLSTLPRAVFHADEPSDPLALPTLKLADLAADHVKVVLGGDGGDEVFGGYDRYYGNLYADRYARLPRWIRRMAVGPMLDLMPAGNWYKSRTHQLRWLHESSFLDGGARYAYTLTHFYFDRQAREELYGETMRSEWGAFDAEAAIRDPWEQAQAKHPIDRMLAADSAVRLPDHPVMITDRMTMAHGLEARSPFMDHRLVEFAARLPVSMKVRGRNLRWAQKRLAERHLPPEILNRPKQGFASALPYMLKHQYTTLYDSLLRRGRLVQEGLVRNEVVERLVMENQNGARDHGQRLWLLLNAEVWYRMYMDRESVSDLEGQIEGRIHAQDAA